MQSSQPDDETRHASLSSYRLMPKAGRKRPRTSRFMQQRVASALGVSERKLHLAFEPTGTSFAEFVRRRRLAECKAALASPVSADRSVADIAFGWASRAWLLSIAPSSASTASHLKTRAKRQRPPVSDPPGRRRPFCGK